MNDHLRQLIALCSFCCCLSLLQAGPGAAQRPGIITTVAGNGILGHTDDGGPATQARLSTTAGIFVDGAGDLYIVNGGRIRKVSPSGIITTVAGNGIYGHSGDGGPATEASLAAPEGIFADGAGNLYIADWHSHRIRKVDTSGIITTIAGSGGPGHGAGGFSGDGGRPPRPALGFQLGFLWMA